MLDLSKAYQALKTRDMELHVRRFFWRKSQQDQWDVYTYTKVTFGDIAAGLVLEVAKCKAAEEGFKIDEETARQILKYFYIDDGCLGGDKELVERMKGEMVDGKYQSNH